MMNIFRLTGDLSHLLAILILLSKIWRTRSCSGKHQFRYKYPIKKLNDDEMIFIIFKAFLVAVKSFLHWCS